MALKWLRDKMKYLFWVIWLVIAVFVALVFFEWGGYNQAQRPVGQQVAATVGDQQISFMEFQQEYRDLENQYKQIFGDQFNSETAKQLNLPVQALDRAINQRILQMEARKMGLEATDTELRQFLLDLPIFSDDAGGFVGPDRYRSIIRRGFNMSVDEFEELWRGRLLNDKLQTVLSQSLFVSDSDVERAYRDTAERAKVRFVELPATDMSDVSAQREELEAYFAENSSDYEIPEQRRADYLLVDTVKLRNEIEISEEELQAYYDDHQEDYTREEQVRASHILLKVTPDRPEAQAERELFDVRQRVEGGEEFAALAQQLSEDEGSASRGGNLGFFGRGRMIKAFEDAAFQAAPGELVGPIKTDFGFHLIKVEEQRPGGLQPFQQVRGLIRSSLVGERVQKIADTKAQEIGKRIADEDLRSEEALRALAEEESLTYEITDAFGRVDAVPKIGRSGEFSETAFGLEVDAVSEPVKVPRGWAILRLREVLPPRVPELAEVEDKIRTAVEGDKRMAASLERLRELRATADAEGLDAVAGELGLEVQESNEFGRRDSLGTLGRAQEAIDAALSLEAGQLAGPFETPQGAALFEVTERKTFDPTTFADEKESTREAQESQRLNQVLSSLVELRRRDLEPQYSKDVFTAFGIDEPAAGV